MPPMPPVVAFAVIVGIGVVGGGVGGVVVVGGVFVGGVGGVVGVGVGGVAGVGAVFFRFVVEVVFGVVVASMADVFVVVAVQSFTGRHAARKTSAARTRTGNTTRAGCA